MKTIKITEEFRHNGKILGYYWPGTNSFWFYYVNKDKTKEYFQDDTHSLEII